ncbi:MAG: hypothetical protein MR290_00515 [Ruminococcus sp.]|nr:hypothetical protein [Ruminococcus sp.]
MKNPVLRQYLLCLFLLLLLFAAVFGTVRAKENSEFARTGKQAEQVDMNDIAKELENLLQPILH